MDLEDLFRSGRTLQWADLPERLWATTGIVIPNREHYEEFGKLRNGLQHFGPKPGVDSSDETLRFIFDVIDPLINDCWELFAVDFDEDDEPYIYFVNALVQREILFRVSPDAAATFENWNVDWSCVSNAYRQEIESRVRTSQSQINQTVEG